MEIRHIGVIGSGISGLVTAKTFLEAGYDVTVFEKKSGLGGVWEKSRTYPELTSQNTSDTYCFSDYPMPKSYPDWPSAAQIRDYLESYAQHFGIIEKIRFETEVINVYKKAESEPTWVITIKTKDSHGIEIKEESHEFDFVVVCNGTFSSPNLPCLPGKDEFTKSGGLVLHSTEFNNTSMIKGKRIVVVGVGKSACDIATLGAKNSQECTLLFRKSMWKVPRFLLGLINLKYILLTRFSEAWFPYYQMGRLEAILHSFGKPLVWFFWRTVEILLRLQFGLDSCGMIPEHQIDKLDCGISVAPPGFFNYIRSGKIKPIKTTIAKFFAGGVELENGEQILADVVIFGTGFRQELPFLSEKYRQMLINEEGNFQLYRHLIHPEIPQMGFVGYSDSFYNQLTSEIGALWLVEYVNDKFSLPSTAQMYQEIFAELDWIKTHFNAVVSSANCINSFSLRHIEQLIKDIDVKNKIVIWKGISQVMLPVDLSIYHQVKQKLASLKLHKNDVI